MPTEGGAGAVLRGAPAILVVAGAPLLESGLIIGKVMDALAVPLVAAFRGGLRDALDRVAGDAVRLIQETGTLDAARTQALHEVLRQYVHTLAPDAVA